MTHHEPRFKSQTAVNVGGLERLISVLFGGFLAAKAARKGGFFRTVASGYLLHRGTTGHCGLYRALGFTTAGPRGIELNESITVNRPVAEVWSFWRNLQNLPEFMDHLKEVKVIDSKRSHWVAEAPGDIKIEWDAEIVGERENEFIAWRSLPYSDIKTQGFVEFLQAPGHKGTEIRVHMVYDLPGAGPAAGVKRLLENITFRQLRTELMRFKDRMEGVRGPSRVVGE